LVDALYRRRDLDGLMYSLKKEGCKKRDKMPTRVESDKGRTPVCFSFIAVFS